MKVKVNIFKGKIYECQFNPFFAGFTSGFSTNIQNGYNSGVTLQSTFNNNNNNIGSSYNNNNNNIGSSYSSGGVQQPFATQQAGYTGGSFGGHSFSNNNGYQVRRMHKPYIKADSSRRLQSFHLR